MKLLPLLLAAATSALAQTNDVTKVRVTGDNVSLRPQSNLDCEILDRAMRGQEMVYQDQTNGWVAVAAPETLDFWVSAEYIADGIVQPKKLNVRSGPSRNYTVVAVALRDEKLKVRGEFNGWLKIAPPAGSRVWISADYVDIIEPPKPEPVPTPVAVEKPAPKPTEKPEPRVVTGSPESKPLVLVIDKSRPQGKVDKFPGVLRRANPGLYKLVLIDGGIEEPICLVRGRESQLEKMLNRSLLIEGKVYWAKDVELPIIQPTKINLDPIIVD